MFGFPRTTEFNKRIPKQKFYENATVSSSLKRAFIDQIKEIKWCNKLAESTVNIASGAKVSEIEVIEIQLNQSKLDEGVIKLIDKAIPYPILFILTHGNTSQAWIQFSFVESADEKVKSRYFHTEWTAREDLAFSVEGLSLDAVWESLIIQVSGLKPQDGRSLSEEIQIEETKERLVRELKKLEQKAGKEKQPNKRFTMATQVNELRKQLLKFGVELGV